MFDIDSNIKSAISIDEDTSETQRQATEKYQHIKIVNDQLIKCLQNLRGQLESANDQKKKLLIILQRERKCLAAAKKDLWEEEQRNKRKIELMEKSKLNLVQEIEIYKEQLARKIQKIKALEKSLICFQNDHHAVDYALKQQNQMKSRLTFDHHQAERIQQLEIILSQKQENLNLLRKKNHDLEIECEQFRQNKQILTEELANKEALLSKLSESIHLQVHYYQKEINQMHKQLQNCRKEKEHNKLILEGLVDGQGQKWSKVNGSLAAKIKQCQKKMQRYEQSETTIKKELQKMKKQTIQKTDEINQLRATVEQYKKILDETKMEFINSQLIKLQENQKSIKQKKQLMRKAKNEGQVIKLNQKQGNYFFPISQSGLKTLKKDKSTDSVSNLTPQREINKQNQGDKSNSNLNKSNKFSKVQISGRRFTIR